MKRSTTIKLGFILLLSVILRVAAAFYLGNEVVSLPGTADQVSYHALALRVMNGHGFTFDSNWWPVTAAGEPTAHWSYLYTLYLAGVYALFGAQPLVARLIQAVIVGVLHPYLAYYIAGQIFQTRREATARHDESGVQLPGEGRPSFGISDEVASAIPLIAAAITAVYAYFIYYAATLMTEPFYITTVLASIALTITLASHSSGQRRYTLAIALGLALGSAVLLRQLYMLFIPFLLLWLFVVTYKKHSSTYMVPSIVMVIGVIVLMIVPATLYNYLRFDRFVLLNTNAGYAFYLANHPAYGTEFAPASEMVDYAGMIPGELRDLDEAALDRELLTRGIQIVLNDPERYVRLSLSRIPIYFKFWPDPSSGLLSNIARVGSFGLFLPFILYGLLRVFVNTRRSSRGRYVTFPPATVVLLYLFIVFYSGIHILSWVQVRYRLPVDAIFVVFAALAIAELIGLTRNAIKSREGRTGKRVSLEPNEYLAE